MEAWLSARCRAQSEGVLIPLTLPLRSLSQVQMKLDLFPFSYYRTSNVAYLVRVILVVVFIFIAAGCASISYKPSLSLDESPKTIKARALIQKFTDESPADDKDTKFSGVSVAEPGTLEGDLATGVTNAILSDFRDNRVFLDVGKSLDNHDVVIKGRILRFYGKGGINGLGWFTILLSFPLWYFGLPIQTVEEEVSIEISLWQPDGSQIATYKGYVQDSEDFSMYTQVALSAPSRTNNAFGRAVRQIRDLMLKDEEKIVKRKK